MLAVRQRATGTILNPWFEYPISWMTSVERGLEETAHLISPCSLMRFPDYDLDVITGPRELMFAATGDYEPAMRIAHLIQAYVSYRTLIAYNLVSFADLPDPRPEPRDPFRFSRLRMQLEERGDRESYQGSTEEIVEISSSDIRTFLKVFDAVLAQALQHYLNVTDVRYVLVEYYKAFEAVRKSLGGNIAVTRTLGITKPEQSRFTALCNDQSQAPSELSRHAATPGVSIHRIDPRRAFEDARFMRDFDTGATFTRKLIDACINGSCQLIRPRRGSAHP